MKFIKNLFIVCLMGFFSSIHAMEGRRSPTKSVDAIEGAGKTALHNAAIAGDAKVVGSLLEAGANVNCTMLATNDTPLMLALIHRHYKVALLLLAKGADPTIADGCGGTPLHIAADNLLLTKALVQRKALVNAATYKDLTTPLHNASHSGTVDSVKVLLDAGANPNAVESSGVTPLENAMGQRKWDIATLLLSRGASFNTVVNRDGFTVFHRVCACGNVEQIEFALKNGAEINCADKCGATPLLWATGAEKTENALYLINAGADIHQVWMQNDASDTVLSYAAAHGLTPVVAEVLKRGFPVDWVNSKGCTALHRAAAAGYLNIVESLLQAGARVDIANPQGITALHCGVIKGNPAIVKLLLEAGALPNAVNKDGLTSLHDAALAGNHAIVSLLIKHGCWLDKLSKGNVTPLMNALAKGHVTIIRAILDAGADVAVRNGFGLSVLHYLVRYSRLYPDKVLHSFIEQMIKKGLDLNCTDNTGGTALMAAVEMGNETLVAYLLKIGADVTIADRYGMTALHYAARLGNAALVETLLKRGANREVRDSLGKTAAAYDKAHCFVMYDKKEQKKRTEQKKKQAKADKKAQNAQRIVEILNRPPQKREEPLLEIDINRDGAAILHDQKSGFGELSMDELQQNPAVEKESLQSVALPLFASRVTDWADKQFLQKKKRAFLADPRKGYWHYKCSKLYHQLPIDVVGALVAHGKPEPRKNKTYKTLDTRWVLEGTMEFCDAAKNPWKPGKSRQHGFYHCTKGSDGKIYHIGFDAVDEEFRTLGAFLDPRLALDDSLLAVNDYQRGIRHLLKKP